MDHWKNIIETYTTENPRKKVSRDMTYFIFV